MFSFASGGTSINGGFSANRLDNSPVSFGGSITQGNISTGATTQGGDSSATGGTSSQSLDLSIPPIPALMQLVLATVSPRLNGSAKFTINQDLEFDKTHSFTPTLSGTSVLNAGGTLKFETGSFGLITAIDKSVANLGDVILEKGSKLNVQANGGRINIKSLRDLTGGQGYYVSIANGGVVDIPHGIQHALLLL